MPAKVYSYIRFSTPDQAKGNSKKRQLEGTKKYAKEKGLVFDESNSLEDLGLSGFSGANQKKGALGMFLALVKKGEVERGSYLVVEDVDRLTRTEPTDAFDLLHQIIEAGITLVTTSDGQEYSKELLNRDPMGFVKFTVATSLAHKASKDKSNKLKSTWANKRNEAQSNSKRKITSRCPAWLFYDRETKVFEVIEDRAELVRWLFKSALGSRGKDVLARELNEKQEEPWGEGKRKGTGWHSSYIQKILHNRSVLGEFQPHSMVDGKRKPDGGPIANYFPAVIESHLFQQVQEKLAQSRQITGKRSIEVSNLFTGIAVSGHTKASVRFVNKGNGRKGGKYLVSSSAIMNLGERYCSWPYESFETLFLDYVQDLDWLQILGEANKHGTKRLELKQDLASAKHDLKDIEIEIANLVEFIAKGKAEALEPFVQKAEESQKRKNDLKSDIKLKEAQLAQLVKLEDAFHATADMLKTVKSRRHELATRILIRDSIRETIERIEIYFLGINPSEEWFIERVRNTANYTRLCEEYATNPFAIFKDYRSFPKIRTSCRAFGSYPTEEEPLNKAMYFLGSNPIDNWILIRVHNKKSYTGLSEAYDRLNAIIFKDYRALNPWRVFTGRPNEEQLIKTSITSSFKSAPRCFVILFKNGAKRFVQPSKSDPLIAEHFAGWGGDSIEMRTIA